MDGVSNIVQMLFKGIALKEGLAQGRRNVAGANQAEFFRDLRGRFNVHQAGIIFREHSGDGTPAGGDNRQTKGQRFYQARRLPFGRIITGKAEYIGVAQFLIFSLIGDKTEDADGVLRVSPGSRRY